MKKFGMKIILLASYLIEVWVAISVAGIALTSPRECQYLAWNFFTLIAKLAQ